MPSKALLDMIRRRHSKKDGTLKKLKRPPKWLEPLSIYRQYRNSLYQYTLEIRRVVSEVVFPQLNKWLLGGTITYPDPVLPDYKRSDSIIDDVIDDINDAMLLIESLLLPSQTRVQQYAARIGLNIATFNKIQYDKTVESVLGVDIFLEEAWLEAQLDLFASQNAELISSLTADEIGRVSGIIKRALQEGSNYDSVAENIEKSFGITRRHARLIARDQTTKLNGSLTKLRQQEAGISEYRWLTSGDERVRPDHRVMDGKICRWDDPTVYLDESTGKWEKRSKIGGTLVHTSQDVNCRCVPLIVIESMFNE